ncbi:hypothetical protein GQX74_013157 [Glossina fuscipes]|nr:hypothetical protein GQX74_013157 [Glossina fuscipes]
MQLLASSIMPISMPANYLLVVIFFNINFNYHDDEEPKGDFVIAVRKEEIQQIIFVFLGNVEKTHARQPRMIDLDLIFNGVAYHFTMTRNGLKYYCEGKRQDLQNPMKKADTGLGVELSSPNSDDCKSEVCNIRNENLVLQKNDGIPQYTTRFRLQES